MKAVRHGLWGICFWLLGTGALPAQKIQDLNSHGWYMYFGDHPVSDRWGLHLEGQWRRANVVTQWQQLLLRPGVNYSLRPNLMLTLGYGYVRSHPYGDFPGPEVFPEHRIFQQLLAKHKSGPLRWQHRFRLEQRFVHLSGQAPRPEWQYRNRFRYMLRSDLPLQRGALARKGAYLGLYDEIFLAFGGHRGPQAVDQNRAYGAVGYNFGLIGRLEAGYLHQYIPQRNGRIVEHNHTAQLAFYSNFPFRKRQ